MHSKEFTEHSEDESVSEMLIQRQFHEILTQTKSPHRVDESSEDVINSQGVTFITINGCVT